MPVVYIACVNGLQALLDGQLLLMDAGCERYGYSSDVTRCWPVNGRFSPEQAAVYQIVQEVHRHVYDCCVFLDIPWLCIQLSHGVMHH